MVCRYSSWFAAVLLLSPAGVARAEFTFPTERRGAVEAVLEVRVADRPVAPGQAAATYILRLRGPAQLEVLPPQLGDAAGAWKSDWQASYWTEDAGAAVVTLSVALRQLKPGGAPLPDVRLRFREGMEEPWQEVEWLDVLRLAQEMQGPRLPVEPASASWGWWAGLAVFAAALGIGLMMLRRRRTQTPALPPDVRALGELDRLEASALPPAGLAAVFHTQLSEVVRRYVADRFGLKALEQTTAEFLAAVNKVPQLANQQDLLREFCDRCDLAKFAGAGLSPEECRGSAELARTLVQQTRSRNSQLQEMVSVR
jgi:hypothetical protein